MRKVGILSTGGTIAMDRTSTSEHPVPSLTSQDFQQRLTQHLPDDLEIASEDILNIPSAHISLENIQKISRKVNRYAQQNDWDGVVITHGTDTMEESAYLVHLCYSGSLPVVYTGAMRSANEAGYDGLRNLISSIHVATSPQATNLGTLIVMNEQIHSAKELRKLHTQRVDAFQSPPYGPVGEIAFGRVSITRTVVRPSSVLEPKCASPVPLISLTAGFEEALLDALQKITPRGIVIEALGGGRVPPSILPHLIRFIKIGIPVVMTTRCGIGPVVDAYGYEGAHRHLKELGCYFAHYLSGSKARIKLMLALGNGLTHGSQLHDFFEDR